jgi:soluble lytic murein transglycosylase-like protein
MTHRASDWRPLIQLVLAQAWPDMPNGLHWVEAQVNAESDGDPQAHSKSGAMGLMQLMPSTAVELGVLNPYDPKQSIDGGVRYLKQQYDHFPEIPTLVDRLRASWASYNCGRGYVNKAIQINRYFLGDTTDWWRWEGIAWGLRQPECVVQGRNPRWWETVVYVERIWTYKPGE